MGKKKEQKKKKSETQERTSTGNPSNINLPNSGAEVTYYNVQPPPSRTSRSSHSNEGHVTSSTITIASRQAALNGNITLATPTDVTGGGGGVGGGGEADAAASSSSTSSSSSSSTTSSDIDVLGPAQLALVPRPAGFNPFLVGFPPAHHGAPGFYGPGMPGMPMGGYGPPVGGVLHAAMMASGPLMLPPPSGGHHNDVGGGPGFLGHAGGRMGGELVRPAPRFLHPEYEVDRMALVQGLGHKSPLVMEHPSLRQFVIVMAVLFVLALVALIVTAIYFGRSTEASWNI